MRIEICEWSRFQHFKDRDPIWLKLYRELRHKREWRRLDGDAAKFLIDLWMFASEQATPGVIDLPLEDIAWEFRSDVGTVQRWIYVLAGNGFIMAISEREQADSPHALAREETEREKETEASANADEGEPSAEITFGDVMAVVRAELHLGCNDNETRRSGSCLSRDFAGKVAPEDVIDACRGTRKLIEAGLVDRVKPGETVGLRFLRTWKYGNRYLWDAALEAERLGVGLADAPTPRAKRSEPGRLKVALPQEPRRAG